DVSGSEFRLQQPEGIPHQYVEIAALANRPRRPDGVEELLEDRVQPLDFLARDAEVFLKRGTVPGGEFAEFPAEELEVDIQRVERVANLMGDACGEQRQSVEPFRF